MGKPSELLPSYVEAQKSEKSSGEFNSAEDDARKALLDSSWADGLRGVSAVFVMLSHLGLCFWRYIAQPAISEGGPSYFMQRPFVRLVGQGPAWVACFLWLSGFVNALKPVKLMRSGQVDTALSNMAVSSFRRAFRLFLPATAATIISWALCQLGAFETARHSDAYWVQATAPVPSFTLFSAFEDLFSAIQSTWTFNPNNPYDQPQWALLYFLQGSMIVFTALLVTSNMTKKFRIATLMFCWYWSWHWSNRLGDPYVCPNMFAGILLAEFSYTSLPYRLSRYSLLWTIPMTALSLLLMSFPSEYQHHASWSLILFKLHVLLAPDHTDLSRFWPTIGAQLLGFTILCSPHLRKVFTNRLCLWLGKISFPLYLLHGMVMRSVLCWILFAGQSLVPMEGSAIRPDNGEKEMIVEMRYPMPSIGMYLIASAVFSIALALSSQWWTMKLEPIFARMTKQAENIMFGREGIVIFRPD